MTKKVNQKNKCKGHNKKTAKSWYKNFWIWLVIIIYILYFIDTSISISEKVIAFGTALFILGYYIKNRQKVQRPTRKQPQTKKTVTIIKYPFLVPVAQCALCNKNLYHGELLLKFKDSAYICKDCMLKYNFPIINTAIVWSATHNR